jgi:hypothetical protein
VIPAYIAIEALSINRGDPDRLLTGVIRIGSDGDEVD